MLDKNNNLCYNGKIDPDRGMLLDCQKHTRKELLKVVYDVDDVLWGLNRRIFSYLDLDLSQNVVYRISENPYFSPGEKQAIMTAYQDAKHFEDMEFFPGASEILAVEPYGAAVRIHSNCYNEEIVAQKRPQLEKLLPYMNPAHMRLAVISLQTHHKHIDQDAYIFIDDNPNNILTSTAKFNFLPICPWNSTAQAEELMTADGRQVIPIKEIKSRATQLVESHQKYIIYGQDLQEINRAIITIVKAKQGDKDA